VAFPDYSGIGLRPLADTNRFETGAGLIEGLPSGLTAAWTKECGFCPAMRFLLVLA